MPRDTKWRRPPLRVVLTAPLLLVFLSVPRALAQQPPRSNRPPDVPADYVITPFGWFHPSCVGAAASGDTVFTDGRVRHADGTVDPAAPVCGYLSYTARGELITSTSPDVDGWIETAHTANPAPSGTSFRKLTATWTVPPPPTTPHGQTLYFFPGLQDTHDPNGQRLIIQPVLAWNQGSVHWPDDPGLPGVWSIGSWACCTSGIPWHSTFRQVQTGDMLDGTMESTCGSGTFTCPTWAITTTDLASSATTVLNTSNWGRTFDWAFEGALEVAALFPPAPISYCTDYPPNGALTFASVNLYNYNESEPISNPGWSWDPRYQNVDPQCWYGDGGQVPLPPTQLTLYYGLVASPAALNFGQHYTDQPPVYLTTTLTNPSISQPAPIVSIGQNLPGYFLVSGTTCGSSLGAGSTCSITVELNLASAPVGTIKKNMAIVYGSGTSAAQLSVPLAATVSCRYNCFIPVGGP